MTAVDSFDRIVRRAVALGVASTIAGVIAGGVGGRIMMRISAGTASDIVQGAATAGGNTVGVISVGGTISLILFAGLASGVAGAATLVILDPWLRSVPRWSRGLVVGLFAFAVAGVLAIEADNFDFRILGHPLLDVVMLAALFPLYGYLALWFGDRLEQRWSRYDANPWMGFALVLGGFASVGMTMALYLSDDTVEPPRLILLGLVLIAAATVGHWAQQLRGTRNVPWLWIVAATGAALVLIPGLAHMVDQISPIL